MPTDKKARFPVKSKEWREAFIADDKCPECGGELDTGWECNDCGFDARPELKASPAWPEEQ